MGNKKADCDAHEVDHVDGPDAVLPNYRIYIARVARDKNECVLLTYPLSQSYTEMPAHSRPVAAQVARAVDRGLGRPETRAQGTES